MSVYPKIHLSFPVRDLDRSIAFYKKFFGEDPVKTHPGYVKFLPSIAPLNLALHADGKAAGDGANHFGIEVRDHETVLRHLQRIRVSGLEPREEMDCDCCYANQDKFWVEDPDGREWEIYVLNRDLDEPGGRGVDVSGGNDASGGRDEAACCAKLEPGGPSEQLRTSQAHSFDATTCCGG